MLVTKTKTKIKRHIYNSASHTSTFQQYLLTCTNNQTQQTLSSVSNHPWWTLTLYLVNNSHCQTFVSTTTVITTKLSLFRFLNANLCHCHYHPCSSSGALITYKRTKSTNLLLGLSSLTMVVVFSFQSSMSHTDNINHSLYYISLHWLQWSYNSDKLNTNQKSVHLNRRLQSKTWLVVDNEM